MRVLVAVLFAFAVVFADIEATATVVSTVLTATESASNVVTSTQSMPVTKTVTAETTHSTTYTVSATETASATQSAAVTTSAVVTTSAEETVTTAVTKTQIAPTATSLPVPNLSGSWFTSNINCSAPSPVFDTAYLVSYVNSTVDTSLFLFAPVDAKFVGGLVVEYENGSFVGVSSGMAFCAGTASGDKASIRCILPVSGQISTICTAALTKQVPTTSTHSVIVTSTTVAPTVPADYRDISGRWAVSNVKCSAKQDAFDKAYDVTKVNNTFYEFTPLDKNYAGGLVVELDASTFVGISSALNGCKGIIVNSGNATISCLVAQAPCTADLTLEAKISTITSSTEENSASMIALSFVIVAIVALF